MSNTYELVTQQILELLETGVAPWRQPFAATPHQNHLTGREYSGTNVLLLHVAMFKRGFTSTRWVTFQNALAAGGNVRKGEKGQKILLWKPLRIEEGDGAPAEERTAKTIPFVQTHTVFNLDQCEGLPVEYPQEITKPSGISACQEVIDKMPNPPLISQSPGGAWYSICEDRVNIPELSTFLSSEAYYSVAFHELAHSTRHRSRLDRRADGEDPNQPRKFGSPEYSLEELTAELTAAFLCAHTGIAPSNVENSASYIKGWLQALKNDHRMVIAASASAQRAADYILGKHQTIAPAASTTKSIAA